MDSNSKSFCFHISIICLKSSASTEDIGKLVRASIVVNSAQNLFLDGTRPVLLTIFRFLVNSAIRLCFQRYSVFYFYFGTKINVDKIIVEFLALTFVGSWLIAPHRRFSGQIIRKNYPMCLRTTHCQSENALNKALTTLVNSYVLDLTTYSWVNVLLKFHVSELW